MNVAAEPAAQPRASIRPLDRFEAGALLVLFALACAPLAGLLLRVWTQGGVVTGGDEFSSPTRSSTSPGCARRASTWAWPTSTTSRRSRCVRAPGCSCRDWLTARAGARAAYIIWKPVAVLALFAAAVALRAASWFAATTVASRSLLALSLRFARRRAGGLEPLGRPRPEDRFRLHYRRAVARGRGYG